MNFFIAHPTTAGVYDGFGGQVWASVKYGLNDGSTNASVNVEWKSPTSDTYIYDIVPAADFDLTYDTQDDWTLLETEYDGATPGNGDELCTEKW